MTMHADQTPLPGLYAELQGVVQDCERRIEFHERAKAPLAECRDRAIAVLEWMDTGTDVLVEARHLLAGEREPAKPSPVQGPPMAEAQPDEKAAPGPGAGFQPGSLSADILALMTEGGDPGTVWSADEIAAALPAGSATSRRQVAKLLEYMRGQGAVRKFPDPANRSRVRYRIATHDQSTASAKERAMDG